MEILSNLQGMDSVSEQRYVVPADFAIVARGAHCHFKKRKRKY